MLVTQSEEFNIDPLFSVPFGTSVGEELTSVFLLCASSIIFLHLYIICENRAIGCFRVLWRYYINNKDTGKLLLSASTIP